MYFVCIDIGIDKTTVSRSPGYNGAAVSQVALRNANCDFEKFIETEICKRDDKWTIVSNHQDHASNQVNRNFFGCPWKMTVKERGPMREFANLIFDAILNNDSDLHYNSITKEKNFVLGVTCTSDWIYSFSDAEQQYIDFLKYECGLPIDCCLDRSNAIYNSRYNIFKENDSVLIIDVGSSTIDFSIYVKSRCISSCCYGANVGTHSIVDILIRHILHDGNNAENLQKLIEFRNSMGYDGDILSKLSLYVQTSVERYFLEEQYAFSLRLSYNELTPGWSGSPWDVCIAFYASKNEFDKIITRYIASVNNTLANAKIRLNQNGIIPNQVIISGNTAGVMFIRDYVAQVFDVYPNINCLPETDASNGMAIWMSNNYKYQNSRDNSCSTPSKLNTLVIDVDWIELNFYTYLGSYFDRVLSWCTNLGVHRISDVLSKEIFNYSSNKKIIEHCKKMGLSGNINIEPSIQKELRAHYMENKDDFQIQVECSILVPQWSGSKWDCIEFNATKDKYEQLISGYKKDVESELLQAKYKFELRGVNVERVLIQGNWKMVNFIKDYIEDIFKIKVESSIV